ncbi:30S ribosome-binding factor RbfA [Ponticaulis profundi]|uniref:Ribosome-binding factor A n=1 Tax=Ponticaulis profundi TaxID=2665222 RepID=A0ABW1S8E8_9PROT
MTKHKNMSAQGPSQRQLRAGELIRHALVDIMAREEFRDPALQGVSVTIGEVRTSPDLKHATIFCSPLVGSQDADGVADALNRASAFIRGKLGRVIDMKFTPQLRFLADKSYDDANAMERLLDNVAEREGFHDEDE